MRADLNTCSTAIDAYAMRRRRVLLAENPQCRSEAITDFILSTAQAAHDLRQFTDARRHGAKLSQEAEGAMQYLEDMIRCRYRECFGTELGQ